MTKATRAPERVDSLTTRVAHAGHGAHRFVGHDLFGGLLGEESLTGLIALSVTGRRISSEEKELLDCLSVVLSVADPRIWPLKINRLVGAYGGALAAFGAQICVEGDLIGMWSAGYAAQTLVELHTALTQSCGADLDALLEAKKRLTGYGVPFRPRDERLDALRECLEKRGRTNLTFWQLQEQMSEIVLRTRGIAPNIVIGAAAMLLDMGFEVRQVSPMAHFFNLPVFVANAVEGAAQAPAVLRCLPDDAIDYIGVAPRLSERAQRRPGALSVP